MWNVNGMKSAPRDRVLKTKFPTLNRYINGEGQIQSTVAVWFPLRFYLDISFLFSHQKLE